MADPASAPKEVSIDNFIGTLGNMMDDPDSKEGQALLQYAKGLETKYPDGLKKEQFAQDVLTTFPDFGKHYRIMGLPERSDAPPLPGEGFYGKDFLKAAFTGAPEMFTGKSLQQRYHESMEEKDKSAPPGIARDITRFHEGLVEGAIGMIESFTSPASILMMGGGKLAQEGTALGGTGIARGVRGVSRLVAPAFAFKQGEAGWEDFKRYQKTGDAADFGRATAEFFSVVPAAAEIGGEFQRGGVFRPKGKTAPAPPGAEAPTPQAASAAPPGAPAIPPPVERRALPAPGEGALPHEAVQDIAAGAGPFRQQAHQWSTLPREELEGLQQQAQKDYDRISGHLGGETAPFKEGKMPGDLRRKMNDAKSKLDVLNKLVALKRRQQFGGWEREVPHGEAGGRPMPPGAQRAITGPESKQGPPGAGPLPSPTGRTEAPPGAGGRRQLPEGSKFAPQPEWGTTVEWAKKLPPETVQGMVDRMKQAATENAIRMHQEAGNDPQKLAELQQFMQGAKARIDELSALLPKKSTVAPTPSTEAKAATSATARLERDTGGRQPKSAAEALKEKAVERAKKARERENPSAALRTDTVDMSAIRSLPPVPQGMVRIFRGELSPDAPKAPVPEWLQDAAKYDPKMISSRQAAGRWATEDPAIAQWYVNDAGAHGRMTYQDVPKDVVDKSRVSNNPEARKFSADPEHELFLPSEYAGKGTPVTSKKAAAPAQPKPSNVRQEVGAIQPHHASLAARAVIEARKWGSKRAMITVYDKAGHEIGEQPFNPQELRSTDALEPLAKAIAKGLAARARVSAMDMTGKKLEFEIKPPDEHTMNLLRPKAPAASAAAPPGA